MIEKNQEVADYILISPIIIKWITTELMQLDDKSN